MSDSPRFGGHFLIASPYLTDGHFFRSVVLIARHEPDGALGWIINRPSDKRFGELVELSEVSGVSTHFKDDLLHIGGPVEGPLVAIHDVIGLGDPVGGTEPAGHADAIGWVTAEEEQLRMLHSRPGARRRWVVGYAGWGPGQLDNEMDAGGWLVTPADTATLFDDTDEVWETLVQRCGREILRRLSPDLPPGALGPGDRRGDGPEDLLPRKPFDPTLN